MAYVKAKDALLSEPDEDGVDIAMVSSDPENTNGQKSNVVHGVRGKRNEAKSKKKLTKVGTRKKRTPSRKKAKGALISISKVEEDGVTDNVDTEMVPSDPVMNGKESIISVSVHDENNLTDDVASGTATSNRRGIIDNIDTGIATSRQMNLGKAGKKKMAWKMNSKESNAVPGIQDKVEHLKELEVGDRNFEKNTNKEVTNEVDSRNEAKNKEKPEGNSKNKVSELRKTGRKKIALRGTNEVVAKKRLNPESSNKTRMKDNVTGMIFMCSSKTKEDCFHYNVFGLPANKRDMVLKIYEGMRLFLFDYDLKMMSGIYKAAGPGGYNIVPKAFQSAFPSQVRFTVLEDCLPLPEEKFKKIIKDNYYSTNKFDCQLTFKQVKNLCELFKVSSKGSKSKRLHESSRAEAPTFVDHLSKRPRRNWKNERAETQEFFYHGHRHVWEERHPASSRDQLYSVDPVEYRRELYASPVAHPPLPHSVHPPLASELPPSETDFYRRDQLRYHCEQFLDVELRHRDEFKHHDSYRRFYHDEFEHRDSYGRFHHDEFEHHDSYRRFHHDEFERHDSYGRSQRQVEFNHCDTYRRSQHQDEFNHRGNYRRSRHQGEFKRHYKRSREHQLDHHPSSSVAKHPKYSSPASRRPASKDHQTARLPADKRPGRSVLRSIVLK